MRIGILYNPDQVDRATASDFAAAIVSAGGSAHVTSGPDGIGEVDRIVVLGGDGTVLHAAKYASMRRIPLVGVNFGHIGFLTEFEREDVQKAIGLVLDENCPKIARSMLEAEIGGKKTDCLNELALLREVSPGRDNSVKKISVTIDGSSAGDFTADGLIVATPTGSTAYSLSAGGSIVTPDCAAFLLTPICAFSLKSRPIVFPDSSVLKFSFEEEESLLAYGDGVFLGRAETGLSVKKSEREVVFLTRNRQEFFHRLTQKIN